MKNILKFFFCLVLYLIFSNSAFAKMSDAEFNSQMNTLKTVRKAENKVVNQKIKVKTEEISGIYLDTKLSPKQKEEKIKSIEAELSELYVEKERINKAYKKKKKKLKRAH